MTANDGIVAFQQFEKMNKENIAVEVSNLTIAYGNFKAVNDISFTVYRGEIFGFLGANGAGKTTTIRAICGLLTPNSGYIKIDGTGPEDGISAIKSKIGYMSQKFTLYSDLSINENLSFAAALRKIPENIFKSRITELFDFIGLNYPGATLVKNLPSGTRQQVALISSILHNPEIIFLDEPTSGVAPEARAKFWELIRKLAKSGKTVFVTTHYMDEAENCGRIALMHAGKIIALDTPENLKEKTFKEPIFEIEAEKKIAVGLVKMLLDENIAEIHPYGMYYHLAVKNKDKWERLLKSSGTLFKYSKIKPSLEDVFIKVMREAENER